MRAVKVLLVCMGVSLSACASTVENEIPDTYTVYNQDQWDKDLDGCRKHALKTHQGFSPQAIGSAAVKGAAQNAGEAPINILIPVAGAGGGLVYETFEEFGITDLRQQKIFVKCLDRTTEWDHSAIEDEPNP